MWIQLENNIGNKDKKAIKMKNKKGKIDIGT